MKRHLQSEYAGLRRAFAKAERVCRCIEIPGGWQGYNGLRRLIRTNPRHLRYPLGMQLAMSGDSVYLYGFATAGL
jgi:hypothetical protein